MFPIQEIVYNPLNPIHLNHYHVNSLIESDPDRATAFLYPVTYVPCLLTIGSCTLLLPNHTLSINDVPFTLRCYDSNSLIIAVEIVIHMYTAPLKIEAVPNIFFTEFIPIHRHHHK